MTAPVDQVQLSRVVALCAQLTRALQMLGSPIKPHLTATQRITAIQNVVCDHYQIVPSSMRARLRDNEHARPRQIAMFLCRNLTGLTFETIARGFERDHGTIIHALRSVTDEISVNKRFAEEVKQLSEIATIALGLENTKP